MRPWDRVIRQEAFERLSLSSVDPTETFPMRWPLLIFTSLSVTACFTPGDTPQTNFGSETSSGSAPTSSSSQSSATSGSETTDGTSGGTTTGGSTTDAPGTGSGATSGGPDTSETGTETGAPASCDDTPTVCGDEETCVANDCVLVPAGMVPVPGGPFQMGCNAVAEDECNEDELPYHEVMLDSFAIGQTEVSQGQYQECVDAGQCSAPGTGSTCRQGSRGSDLPVVCVSWFSARDYCDFIGGRLPTEAEWEKAARGENGAAFPWGEADPDCDLAAYNECTGTEPVTSNPGGASPYGALNMAGNVFEWTSDWYQSTYYASSPTSNPQGPDSGERRTIRSASSNYIAEVMRASFRGPDFEISDTGSSVVGIRCAAPL